MTSHLITLIVDDSLTDRHYFTQILDRAGYQIITAGDYDGAVEYLSSKSINIVVLDLYLGLSYPYGFEILREGRRLCPASEWIVTTSRPGLETAVEALREGACDYLPKPVNATTILESITRVRDKQIQRSQREDALMSIESNIHKVLGRGTPETAPPAHQHKRAAEEQTIGPVLVDFNRHLIAVNGLPINATLTEIQIMQYMCRNRHRVVTAQELFRSIRGIEVESREARETIRSHISNLRRKLVAVDPDADVISTVRSVGYMLKYH